MLQEFHKFKKQILEEWNLSTFAIAFAIQKYTNLSQWSLELGKCSSLIAEFCVRVIPDAVTSANTTMLKFKEKYKELHNETYNGFEVRARTFDHTGFLQKVANRNIERL